MASMSHTMYYHELEALRADEWVLVELNSPWADESRALTTQKMYSMQGKLVATCVQEGLIRLRERDRHPNSQL